MKKNGITILLLGLLMASAFFLRWQTIQNTERFSIDEIVYLKMAVQVKKDPAQYHTIPYGHELAATGRDLPAYFFEPLYKHPPLFTFSLASALTAFGIDWTHAALVPLICGILLIPLVFRMALDAFTPAVAWTSAVVMTFEPVAWITSQKVWPDMPLTLLTALTIFALAKGIREENGRSLLWGAFWCGLAMNVKYTGYLPMLVLVMYAWFYERALLRRKNFYIALAFPFLMLVPWLIWNLKVYGFSYMGAFFEQHGELGQIAGRLKGPALSGGILIGIALVLTRAVRFFQKQRHRNGKQDLTEHEDIPDQFSKREDKICQSSCVTQSSLRLCSWISFGLMTLVGLAILPSILAGFNPASVPRHSWRLGAFAGEPATFYFAQLVEFTPFFLLAWIALLRFDRDERLVKAFYRMQAFLMLLFFMVWGNFQSRYILPLSPLLVILGSHQGCLMWTRFSRLSLPWARTLSRAAFLLFLIACAMKVLRVHQAISLSNDLCYF